MEQRQMKGKDSKRCNPVRKPGPATMDHVLLALQESKDERDLRLRNLFNNFDKLNSGYLDHAQIEAGLSALHIPSQYKYARDLLNVCDANKDGRVDYLKFRRYMDAKELELYRIFQAIDIEHSGCISPVELSDALVKAVGLAEGYAEMPGWTHLKQELRRSSSAALSPAAGSKATQQCCDEEAEGVQSKHRWTYLKVNMDGIVVGRKICLVDLADYASLAIQLEDMFGRLCFSGLQLFEAESEFSLFYMDEEGSWRPAGDVPWKEFVDTVKRLRIVRNNGITMDRFS